jgi:hypothetical protein
MILRRQKIYLIKIRLNNNKIRKRKYMIQHILKYKLKKIPKLIIIRINLQLKVKIQMYFNQTFCINLKYQIHSIIYRKFIGIHSLKQYRVQ